MGLARKRVLHTKMAFEIVKWAQSQKSSLRWLADGELDLRTLDGGGGADRPTLNKY